MHFGVIFAQSSETTFKQIREATCQLQMFSLRYGMKSFHYISDVL